ncbi:tail fiber protein [Pectobacterium aroidearum]|uniref:phage tail protein n=1 Tax=Pectobacterium aroidearum TaxID=1201031 RepID=UPI0015F00968|nr:phage tail protein [Pectobacterium aroidearum]MBA5235297.1 tail fiber protein [Pectobacterium aroidearum]
MFHLDNDSGVPIMPTLPPVKSTEVQFFTEGGNGIPPSWPGATWFNIIQSELINVLLAANIQIDKTKLNQLQDAIKKLVLNGTDNCLKKDQNGADISNKPLFLQNIGISLPLPLESGGAGTIKGSVRNAGTAYEPTSINEYLEYLTGPQSMGSTRISAGIGRWLCHMSVRHRGGNSNGESTGDSDQFGYALIDNNMIVSTYEFMLYKQVAGTWLDPVSLWHTGNLNAASINAISISDLAGIPLPFPGAVAPSGWLKCNGQPFDASQFPVLAARYPTGFLPDLRGEFVRGWDDGRGINPSRGLLTTESDMFAAHAHVIAAGTSNNVTGTHMISSNGVSSEQIGTTNPAGGTETRPRNIAFNYIVRAA